MVEELVLGVPSLRVLNRDIQSCKLLQVIKSNFEMKYREIGLNFTNTVNYAERRKFFKMVKELVNHFPRRMYTR